MRPPRQFGPAPRFRQFSLIEVLVYGAVLLMVLGLAITTFHRGTRSVRGLWRAADDIERVSWVGDRWRGEVRGAVEVTSADGELRLAQSGAGAIRYAVRDGALMRMAVGADWQPCLRGVRSGRFVRHEFEAGSAWEMTLELASQHPHPAVVPVFSFLAVPPGREDGP